MRFLKFVLATLFALAVAIVGVFVAAVIAVGSLTAILVRRLSRATAPHTATVAPQPRSRAAATEVIDVTATEVPPGGH